jgi:CPA2 family monovalent cation:H+ antiporter-2
MSAVLRGAEVAPAFFAEIVALLIVSTVMAYVCHRLGIMPIVSFLLAGALIGPHALGLVHNEALIEAAAEVGVILLLFTIGIEFSLEKLARIKRLIIVGGGLQVGLVIALVAVLLRLFGVDWRIGVFTGFLLALSSTAIVMKLLMTRGEANTEGGQASLGILIFQDLAVVAMVLLVPMLGGGAGSALDLVLAMAKAAGIIFVVLVLARRVMPRVLEAVALTCSQEIFLLTVVAICFGTAWLTSLAGVSLSLGAFLAGLVISESRFSDLAFGEILPLQILFSASFFVSVGLLLDLGFLLANLLLVLAVIAVVLAVKLITTGISLKVLGYGGGTAAFTSLLLAQIGEFSFVLERAGREVGLYPAGLVDGGPETFLAATVLLMIGTPFLAGIGERLRERAAAAVAGRQAEAPPAVESDGLSGLQNHVIIAGFGEAGRRLASGLHAHGTPYLIVTLSPDGAREAEARQMRVLRGNYTRQHELTLAGAHQARLLVVADDDLEMTRRVVSAARALNPALRILVRTRFESEIDELREVGATEVIAEDLASMVSLLARVLETSTVDADPISNEQDALPDSPGSADSRTGPSRETAMAGTPSVIQLNDEQRRTTRCTHTGEARAVTPDAQGCGECLRLGDRWVHLRICMTCGHVGCCDSSKNKHASKHNRGTGHPIIRSFQPGETWAWCYTDRAMF